MPAGYGLSWWLNSKESTCNTGNAGLIPGFDDPLKKKMTIHSSILFCFFHSSVLIWEIPRTEDPGGLPSLGLQRVRHDIVTKPAPPLAGYIAKESSVMFASL